MFVLTYICSNTNSSIPRGSKTVHGRLFQAKKYTCMAEPANIRSY